MLDVLTAEDVRRQDAASEARGIPVATLMANAGYAIARSSRRMLGGTYGKRIVIVCGKGNNAGDGLVAGRILRSGGASCTAVLLGGAEFSGPAGTAFEGFPGAFAEPKDLPRELARADLVIDAIFGVGLSRPPEDDAVFGSAVDALSRGDLPVLSVDLPSGIDADTGRVVGLKAVRAKRTVTLGGLKPGLLFEPGRSHAGAVEVAEIGVPEDVREASAFALEDADVRALLPARRASANKRSVGTVLLVVGSRGLPGAAALSAGGSVHGGAGLTIVAAPESVVPTIVARVPEVTAIPLPETGDGTIDPKAIELIRPRLKEFQVAALGPGLSTHPATAEFVRALVAELEIPVVLDADALTALKGSVELIAGRSKPTVLTPHTRELSRLTGGEVEQIDSDRLRAARDAAAGLGCVLLLKGPGTVIASPDGTAYLTPTGGPGLAQGGTGDVLTGFTAALLAQDAMLDEPRGPHLMAATAAWIHGRAGDRLAERVAPHPASPSMLVEELPRVLHEVAG
jgi:NAD(P)H-hydrate epimerase